MHKKKLNPKHLKDLEKSGLSKTKKKLIEEKLKAAIKKNYPKEDMVKDAEK